MELYKPDILRIIIKIQKYEPLLTNRDSPMRQNESTGEYEDRSFNFHGEKYRSNQVTTLRNCFFFRFTHNERCLYTPKVAVTPLVTSYNSI